MVFIETLLMFKYLCHKLKNVQTSKSRCGRQFNARSSTYRLYLQPSFSYKKDIRASNKEDTKLSSRENGPHSLSSFAKGNMKNSYINYISIFSIGVSYFL